MKARPRVWLAVAIAIMVLGHVINSWNNFVLWVLLVDVMAGVSLPFTLAGLLSTISSLGMGTASLLAGYIFGLWSRRQQFFVGILVSSIFTILTGTATGFPDLLAYRLSMGAGQGIWITTYYATLGALSVRRRGVFLAMGNIGFGIAALTGPPLVAYLSKMTNSWREPFYLLGIVGLGTSLLIALFIRENIIDTKDKESQQAQMALGMDAKVGPWATLRSRNVVIGSSVLVTYGLIQWGYSGLYSTYLRTEAGFEVTMASFAFSFSGIGIILGSLAAGYLGDRLGRKTILTSSGILLAAVGYAMFHYANVLLLAVLWNLLFGILGSSFIFINMYGFLQDSVAKQQIGFITGYSLCLYLISASLAGVLQAHLITTHGWEASSVTIFVLLPSVLATSTAFARRTRRG